jgi:Amt family ammonium transporter
VSPLGAVLIGALAGIVVPLGIDLLEARRIDDPIGAVAVHGFCGIFGTLSIGLFATGDFGIPGPLGADTSGGTVEGLFYGGGADQLIAQFIGSATCVIVVSIAAAALMYGVNATGLLRIGRDEELEGLDIVEHGLTAYHMEFGHGVGYTSPPGSGDLVGAMPTPDTEDAPA